MPFLAGIAPILSAVAAAGTLAATGYELANQPSSSSSATTSTALTSAQQAQQTAAQQAAQKAAFVAAQPNVQAQTGGGLTGTAFNTATATQAGVPSDLNSIARYLGLSTGGGPTNANVSGGITSTPGASPDSSSGSSYDLQTLSDLLKQRG
jgi:hypothetical protein